ncbi:MAG: hypothetical protein U0166_04520 [Acidobacteriota bacterium]
MPADPLEEVEDLLALAEGVQERGVGADVDAGGADRQEVARDAVELGGDDLEVSTRSPTWIFMSFSTVRRSRRELFIAAT